MFATIDPLTGGLIWEKEGEKEKARLAQSKPPEVATLDVNQGFDPRPSRLTLQQKLDLIKPIGEEIMKPEELVQLLERKRFPICYDGFEPSGRMHIAQGLLRALNVNRLVDAGCIFIFWVADWFALLNNKMNGDLNKIRKVGRYFVEVWRAAGMKMHNVLFLWASDEINKRPNDYWLKVLDIARNSSVTRVKRCGQIMGRQDGTKKKKELQKELEKAVDSNEKEKASQLVEELDELKNLKQAIQNWNQEDIKTYMRNYFKEDVQPVAQLFYPCMQCNDIFFLEADICQLGLDQRKVNMLARDYVKTGNKPVVISHHMMYGLKEGQSKMSKSDPDSAIFMEDSAKDVERKIKQAFCPEKVIKENPILDYCKHIVFGWKEKLLIVRKPQHGGNLEYSSYEALEADFASGQLHPEDLKIAVAKALNELIQPVRDHFLNDPDARALLKEIRSFEVTK